MKEKRRRMNVFFFTKKKKMNVIPEEISLKMTIKGIEMAQKERKNSLV